MVGLRAPPRACMRRHEEAESSRAAVAAMLRQEESDGGPPCSATRSLGAGQHAELGRPEGARSRSSSSARPGGRKEAGARENSQRVSGGK
jgi:hypothetical protein